MWCSPFSFSEAKFVQVRRKKSKKEKIAEKQAKQREELEQPRKQVMKYLCAIFKPCPSLIAALGFNLTSCVCVFDSE